MITTIRNITTANHTTPVLGKNDKIDAYIHGQLLFTLMFAYSHVTSIVVPHYGNAAIRSIEISCLA